MYMSKIQSETIRLGDPIQDIFDQSTLDTGKERLDGLEEGVDWEPENRGRRRSRLTLPSWRTC
jgi:hypothetical protein